MRADRKRLALRGVVFNIAGERISKAFKKVTMRNGCFFVNDDKTPELTINTMTIDGLHLDAVSSGKLIELVVALIMK